ncbi:MAG: hypothetical protein GX985_09300 [Gallicola sp.]|nr:hypothetical protein [Gallicola sp.]
MEEDGPKPVSEIQYKNHQEYNKKDLLKFEKEVLGVYLTDHPLRPYEEWINKYSNFTMIDLKEEISLAEAKWDQKEVTMVGIVESINKKFTRNNQLMEFVKFEDLYGMIELIVFPKLYDRYGSLMIEDQVLMVKGRLSLSEMEEPKLIVDKVEELDKNLPSEKIYIKITPSIESQTVEDIKIFLRSYTGEQKSPIQFYFSHSGKSFVLKKEMWADAEDENLIKELEKRLGKQNVKVV